MTSPKNVFLQFCEFDISNVLLELGEDPTYTNKMLTHQLLF